MKITLKIPRQPEVNIGTAGHVDHGKCICLDEQVFAENGLVNCRDLVKLINPNKLKRFRHGRVYSNISLPVYSVNDKLELKLVNSYPYIEYYVGKIIEVSTKTGRRIRVTPNHPLLTLGGKGLEWIEAGRLKRGEKIAVINLSEIKSIYCGKHFIDGWEVSPTQCTLSEVNRLFIKAVVSGFNPLIKKKGSDEFLIEVVDGKIHSGHRLGAVSLDEVVEVRDSWYDDFIIDLVVPKHHNFLAGLGGIVAHNTTLIQALTGIWTSSHSEELRRGITIKIGYADMPIYEYFDDSGRRRLTTTPEASRNTRFIRAISFVDCPGHESLMANMLSGAAVMDGALLIIAANEPCPRPQTKEHMVALEILGVKRIVVIQNKVDLVSKKEAIKNYEQIREFLDSTEVAKNAPIIPVSSIFKINMEYVLEAIEAYIPTPKRDLSKPVRMFIIRSFDVNKPGTPYSEISGGVIGGAIIQGMVKVGDELEIQPGYLEKRGNRIISEPLYTKVLSLSTQYLRLKEAHSGGLIGVQTDLDPSLTRADRMVGNVAGKPGTLPDTRYEFEMETTLFKYVVGTDETITVSKIRVGEPLRLNVGSSTTLGVVDSIKGESVHVRLSKPVVTDEGWKVAIARRINGRWRLIGVGKVI